MKQIINIESFGIVLDNERYATRKQILDFYEVPKTTLADNINQLKEDELVSGTIWRPTASDGKKYKTEVYNLDEIIAMGFRLRSDKAILLQRMAVYSVKKDLIKLGKENLILREETRSLQLENSHAWNLLDRQDLYR